MPSITLYSKLQISIEKKLCIKYYSLGSRQTSLHLVSDHLYKVARVHNFCSNKCLVGFVKWRSKIGDNTLILEMALNWIMWERENWIKVFQVLKKYSRHTTCSGNLLYPVFNTLGFLKDPIFKCSEKTRIEQNTARERSTVGGPLYTTLIIIFARDFGPWGQMLLLYDGI